MPEGQIQSEVVRLPRNRRFRGNRYPVQNWIALQKYSEGATSEFFYTVCRLSRRFSLAPVGKWCYSKYILIFEGA